MYSSQTIFAQIYVVFYSSKIYEIVTVVYVHVIAFKHNGEFHIILFTADTG